MRQIEVEALHDGTFVFTATERAQAPWDSTNTTIFVPPEKLAASCRNCRRDCTKSSRSGRRYLSSFLISRCGSLATSITVSREP